MRLYKLTLFLGVIILFGIPPVLRAQSSPAAAAKSSFRFSASNPSAISRSHELIRIGLKEIRSRFPSFNDKSFVVMCDGKQVPSQLDRERIERGDGVILLVTSFAPHEKKSFSVSWSETGSVLHHYKKLTQAVLGMKVDYKKVNGYYTGGKFVDVDSTTVPKDHFAHDALYRIEGPGWESDKIVYRFYLDSRNRNDIFGKKIDGLVLQKLGINDLVSNSKESYTRMLDWGMDIYKVGESLGIGSIAMWNGTGPVTVSDVRRVKCYVSENGPILSGIYTKYTGWKVSGNAYELYSHLTISAGSRLTKVDLRIKGKPSQLCTGLAIHDGCDFLKSTSTSTSGWKYIALYGKQSLSGDNLGTAVFYRASDEVKLTEDSLSTMVVLRPDGGKLTYYFGAAWEEEPGGIRNEKEFRKYLQETVMKLDNPIEVSL